jgi:PAS domain S-box-containing protein
MDITLDSTEKLVSAILACISGAAYIFRKFIWPRLCRLKAWWVLVRDIGFIKQGLVGIENRLILSDHIVKYLLSKSSIATFISDSKGYYIWTNEALQNIFGADQSEMLKDGWMNFLHPDDITTAFQTWHSSIQNAIPYKVRYRVLKGGETVLCEASAEVVTNATGEIIGYAGEVIPV